MKSGNLDLGKDGMIVDAKVAEANGWKVGDKIRLGMSSLPGVIHILRIRDYRRGWLENL